MMIAKKKENYTYVYTYNLCTYIYVSDGYEYVYTFNNRIENEILFMNSYPIKAKEFFFFFFNKE